MMISSWRALRRVGASMDFAEAAHPRGGTFHAHHQEDDRRSAPGGGGPYLGRSPEDSDSSCNARCRGRYLQHLDARTGHHDRFATLLERLQIVVSTFLQVLVRHCSFPHCSLPHCSFPAPRLIFPIAAAHDQALARGQLGLRQASGRDRMHHQRLGRSDLFNHIQPANRSLTSVPSSPRLLAVAVVELQGDSAERDWRRSHRAVRRRLPAASGSSAMQRQTEAPGAARTSTASTPVVPILPTLPPRLSHGCARWSPPMGQRRQPVLSSCRGQARRRRISLAQPVPAPISAAAAREVSCQPSPIQARPGPGQWRAAPW